MLDVHPPEHAMHSWRDFFIHIATIVIGLLIAIGLEQSVEWMHHRHIVHVARETIHAELETNRKLAFDNLEQIRKAESAMQYNMRLAQVFEKNPHATERHHMSFNFGWSGFSDSAWRTARDTGALALMPVDEVQRYADVYGQEVIVNTQAVTLFEDLPEASAPLLMTPDPENLSPENLQILLLGTTKMYLRLRTLEQLTNELQK